MKSFTKELLERNEEYLKLLEEHRNTLRKYNGALEELVAIKEALIESHDAWKSNNPNTPVYESPFADLFGRIHIVRKGKNESETN